MTCPMRVGSAGYMYDCRLEECGWWDEKRKQCCVKTFMTKESDNKMTVEIDRNTAMEGGW